MPELHPLYGQWLTRSLCEKLRHICISQPIPLWNNNFTTECILRRHLGLMPGKTGLQLSIFTSFHCILSTFAYGLPIYSNNILTYVTYITEYSHTEINTSQDDWRRLVWFFFLMIVMYPLNTSWKYLACKIHQGDVVNYRIRLMYSATSRPPWDSLSRDYRLPMVPALAQIIRHALPHTYR